MNFFQKIFAFFNGKLKQLKDPILNKSIEIVNKIKEVLDGKVFDFLASAMRGEVASNLLTTTRTIIAKTLSELILFKQLTDVEVTEESFKMIMTEVMGVFPQIGQQRAEVLLLLQARLFVDWKAAMEDKKITIGEAVSLGQDAYELIRETIKK